jgi:hypothetical protein
MKHQSTYLNQLKFGFIIVIIAGLVWLCSSCNNDEVQMGCQTGILKTGDPNERITIRCCTKEEHNAGSNVAIGGTDLFQYYTSVKWEPVKDCNECR